MQSKSRKLFTIAALVASFQIAPIVTASVLLLMPFPALLAALHFPSLRPTRRFIFGAMPIGLILFYIGLIGPLCAFVAMPESWGFLDAKDTLLQIGSIAYPWFDDRVMPQSLLLPFASYQEGWAAWVNSAW